MIIGDMYGALLRNVLVPGWESGIRRRPTLQRLAWLEKTQWRSLDELEALQAADLKRLWRHTFAHVPFYRQRAEAAGVGPDDIREPFTLTRTGDGFTLQLQDRDYALRAGRWSDWVSVRFGMGPLGLQKVPAVTRVLPRAEGERVTLYVSPLNFDPRAPLYPISHPRGYSAELADAIGLYATRGMPFDADALNDGVLTEEDFLEHARQLIGCDRRQAANRHALDLV